MLTFSADDHTLTARQLAERTGIALPSVYRYITLLRETGLLAGDERGSYRLSARLIGLARAAEAAESIIDVAAPVMHSLAEQTGETVILVRLIGRSAVCVHRVQSAQQLRICSSPASRCRSSAAPAPGCCWPACPSTSARNTWPRWPKKTRKPPPCSRRRSRWPGSRASRPARRRSTGVWAASAQVTQGKRVLAVLTVPSPLVRAPAEQRTLLLNRVRSAARQISDGLRTARR